MLVRVLRTHVLLVTGTAVHPHNHVIYRCSGAGLRSCATRLAAKALSKALRGVQGQRMFRLSPLVPVCIAALEACSVGC
jgi:hypothetical protein